MAVPDRHEHWQAEAAQASAQVLGALGELTAGGLVEGIEHVGATSVPGLWGTSATSAIDLALAVAPCPLPSTAQAALIALGYEFLPEPSSATQQRFRHLTGAFELYVVESGSEEWVNHLLVRDYLRHDAAARQRYMAHRNAMQANSGGAAAGQQGKAALFAELLAAAVPWWIDHHGFHPMLAVAQELASFPHAWTISSGWALDLFLGQVTRVHHDVDVVVARGDQLALHEYLTARAWQLLTPLRGKVEPWPPHMRLELPRHQVHAHRPGESSGEFIDFLLTDFSDGVWRYRRNPIILRDMAQVALRNSKGVPFLAPELVLLYKSKNTGNRERNKDQADFERVCPHLSREARAWLRWALLATEPDHAWIEQLD